MIAVLVTTAFSPWRASTVEEPVEEPVLVGVW